MDIRHLKKNLSAFSKLSKDVELQRLDGGQGIAATVCAHQAKWHKSCVLRYNNTKLERVEKRTYDDDRPVLSSQPDVYKRTRSQSPCLENFPENVCFFCQDKHLPLHQVVTPELNVQVRKFAEIP